MNVLARVGFVGFVFLAAGAAQAVTIIDFEDWTGGSGEQDMVRSRGYVFGGSLMVGPAPGTNNPTNALHSLGHWIKMMPIRGSASDGPFTLVSFDLQEGSAASQTSSIQLVGYRKGGWQLFETFIMDGLASTCETFYPAGFTEITDFYCYAYTAQGDPSVGFSVDNIVVPEPFSLCLIAPILLVVKPRRRTPA